MAACTSHVEKKIADTMKKFKLFHQIKPRSLNQLANYILSNNLQSKVTSPIFGHWTARGWPTAQFNFIVRRYLAPFGKELRSRTTLALHYANPCGATGVWEALRFIKLNYIEPSTRL